MGWGGGRGHRGAARAQHAQAQQAQHAAGAQWKPGQELHGGGECAAAHAHVPAPQPRPLAAQWRFACRVLRPHAPEERVQDARRQLRLGDHVLVRYSWDNSEQHGIICSASGEARRAEREPHWVAHWDGSRLQCSPLSQLAKGGELARVTYPHWACRLLPPGGSTARPQVLEERLLEAAADEAVARRANGALRGGWAPRWAQGADLEFCLEAKTGGAGPPWELHGRRALASLPLAALGCQLRGERPSQHLGAGARPGARAAAAPPGFAAQPWPPCAAPALAAGLGAYPQERLAGEAAWGASWWEAAWGAGAAPKPAAGSSLSADAQVFVPQSRNWDGIYQ